MLRRPDQSAWKSPGFRAVWVGRFFSLLGTGASTVALQLFLVDRRASSVDISLLFIATTLPQLLGFFIGSRVDQRSSWKLMIWCDLVQLACTLILFALIPTGAILYTLLATVGAAATAFPP